MTTDEFFDAPRVAEVFRALQQAITAVVVGQDTAIRLTFASVLCGGHILFEGVPGVAKTLLVRALAAGVGVGFGRIQCTPDLMPSDIIGTTVFRPNEGEFRFRPGPLFADFLLVDEINRAPAKTQAALLEAMQERAATVDGVSHPLGEWFTVIATQNPVEHEGTYPLPEAELDRFLFKIRIPYPSADDERRVLLLHQGTEPSLAAAAPVVSTRVLAAARAAVRRTVVRDEILDYTVALARATRTDPAIALGVSPRAALWLLRAAKALATIDGRDFVLPDDVQEAVRPAFRHRLTLEPSAEVDGLTPDAAVEQVLRAVPAPH